MYGSLPRPIWLSFLRLQMPKYPVLTNHKVQSYGHLNYNCAHPPTTQAFDFNEVSVSHKSCIMQYKKLIPWKMTADENFWHEKAMKTSLKQSSQSSIYVTVSKQDHTHVHLNLCSYRRINFEEEYFTPINNFEL